MSTAIMSQNAMYEFGDNLIKFFSSNEKIGPQFRMQKLPGDLYNDRHRETVEELIKTRLERDIDLKKSGATLIQNGIPSDTGNGAAHLAVGSTAVRLTLTRMASTPTAANSNQLAALLGNLAAQQQQQQQQQHQHRRLERTQSAPAPPSTAAPPAAALTATTVNTSRYKTELCRPFEEFGVCKYGDKCQFAHGYNELRSLARHPKYKTELCRTYHTVGFCPYGPRCHFVHNQDEVLAQKNGPAPPAMLTRTTSATSRPRPAALSPSLSLDSSSPPCSLSQSPTSTGSFFSSDPELNSPGIDDQRLPVFNRLIDTAHFLSLSDLML